jgi:hypothetical protein
MKNDNPHITRLVQRAPLDLLRPFLAKHAGPFGDESLSSGDHTQTRTALKQAIPGLPDAERQIRPQAAAGASDPNSGRFGIHRIGGLSFIYAVGNLRPGDRPRRCRS